MIHVTNVDCMKDAVRHATCWVVYNTPLIHVPNVGIYKKATIFKNNFIVQIILGEEILIRIFKVVGDDTLNVLNAKHIPAEKTWEWDGIMPFQIVRMICGIKEVESLLESWAVAQKKYHETIAD